MAKDSIACVNREEALRLVRKIMGNISFMEENDMKVLEFLGKKGFYDDKRVVLINKDSKLNNLINEKK